MADTKFVFHDEVLAALMCDDTVAVRLSLILKDYAFPREQQSIVADALLRFTAEWGVAPKEHAYELVEEENRGYLRELSELSTRIHRDYVLARLDKFLREGAQRGAILKALDLLQLADHDGVDTVLDGYRRSRASFFDAGVRLRDAALKELLAEDPDTIAWRSGISALDQAHVGPAPKTMLVFIAPAKRGKSWYLVHQGVTSLRDRKCVVHITLEMNKRQVARRYVQNLLSLTKRTADPIEVTQLLIDNLGRLQGLGVEKIARPKVGPEVFDKANALLSRMRFYIREFPTGSLTINDLRAYLDTLEQVEHVVPDLLIVDYADLMKIDGANLRIDTGIIYRELRGIAMERGCALVTASQSNRSSADAKWVREGDIAEDWSKVMTADTILTYSQTVDERKLGLGRIFVAAVRDENDKWACLITQNYQMGQFCLDSIRLDDDVYWRIVNEHYGRQEQE